MRVVQLSLNKKAVVGHNANMKFIKTGLAKCDNELACSMVLLKIVGAMNANSSLPIDGFLVSEERPALQELVRVGLVQLDYEKVAK